MDTTTNIGWIGLGAMGIPMVKNLVQEGYHITVYNRTKSKLTDLKNEEVATAETPVDVLDQTDVTIIMVSDDQAVRDVFEGNGGLLGSSASGKIIVNMSTVSPDISIEMAKKCESQGHQYMDAPVSGSVKQATEASLVIMAGADKNLFDKTEPLLAKLGKKVFHIGEVGSGNKTKLAVNVFLAITTQGLAEIVLFANKMGIKTDNILDAINTGGLSSPYTKIKSESIKKNQYPSAFALKHMAKDLRLAVDQHLDSALGKAAHNTFNEAQKKSGDEDVMAVIKSIRA